MHYSKARDDFLNSRMGSQLCWQREQQIQSPGHMREQNRCGKLSGSSRTELRKAGEHAFTGGEGRCFMGTADWICPPLPSCYHLSNRCSRSFPRQRTPSPASQMPGPHTLQPSHPLANAVGSAFTTYPEFDHFHHVCCYHCSPRHHHLPSVLPVQLPHRSSSFQLESVSPRVYSQHTGQRDPSKIGYFSAQNLHDVIPPLKIHSEPVASHLTQS